MSGSPIQCALCGLSNGIEMLARPAVTILRAMLSGLTALCMASPIETAQPSASAPTLVRRGRSSRSRTTCASSCRNSSALRMVLLASLPSASMSIGAAVSNTSHSVSARWNTAAGVCSANGKNRRSASPCRRNSTATGRLGWRATRRLLLGGLLGAVASACAAGLAASGFASGLVSVLVSWFLAS